MTSCGPCQYEVPMVTQLQVREVQTRTFEDCEVKTVMKAMINVLQDEGYIVKNAVLDLGLLSAERDVDVEDRRKVFLATMFMGDEARWCKHAVMEASANVTEFGQDVKIRINFQTKTFDNYGCVMDVQQVIDDVYYQNFFAKVSKGIFFQTENL